MGLSCIRVRASAKGHDSCRCARAPATSPAAKRGWSRRARMRLRIERETAPAVLKWAQRALNVCAVVLLSYCAFALVDSWRFQRRESRDLDRLLREQRAASQGTPQPVPIPPEAAPAPWRTDWSAASRSRACSFPRRDGRVDRTTLRARSANSRHGAADRLARGPGRAPGHVLSPAEGLAY